jgi:hypothetical protein
MIGDRPVAASSRNALAAPRPDALDPAAIQTQTDPPRSLPRLLAEVAEDCGSNLQLVMRLAVELRLAPAELREVADVFTIRVALHDARAWRAAA